MRRNWVALDAHDTRCVVLDDQHNVKNRLAAYQLNLARTLLAHDLHRWLLMHSPPREYGVAIRVYQALGETCCYALHCKATDLVKLGRTSNLFGRWAYLEAESGNPLQLVAVWRAPDCTSFERALHERFTTHRVSGEWFSADAVLAFLRVAAIRRHIASATSEQEAEASA
jgi:hypothetical protein